MAGQTSVTMPIAFGDNVLRMEIGANEHSYHHTDDDTDDEAFVYGTGMEEEANGGTDDVGLEQENELANFADDEQHESDEEVFIYSGQDTESRDEQQDNESTLDEDDTDESIFVYAGKDADLNGDTEPQVDEASSLHNVGLPLPHTHLDSQPVDFKRSSNVSSQDCFDQSCDRAHPKLEHVSTVQSQSPSAPPRASLQDDYFNQPHTLDERPSKEEQHFSATAYGEPSREDFGPNEDQFPERSPVFLHPGVSRLRSFLTPTLQTSSSSRTLNSRAEYVTTPTFIQRSKSRSSSMSNLNGNVAPNYTESDEDSLRWTTLRHLDDYLVSKRTGKTRSASTAATLDFYTVLATRGLICVGTDAGRVIVFDAKQQFKCICGDEVSARQLGGVTALAVSHDHTHVAVGHATGHVQIFDINRPKVPARHIIPTSWASVASGRPEGHLLGSRITHLSFVAARHTAFVSANDHGLAFYHSLHKVVFVEDRQVRRILGDYPDEEPLPAGSRSSQTPTTPGQGHRRRPRTTDTILAMEPLFLGASPHPLDPYQLVALLTPTRLRVIGLQPAPKTWHDISRPTDRSMTSKWRGCLAWSPGILSQKDQHPKAKTVLQKSISNSESDATDSQALLAYTWDRTLTILRFTEKRVVQEVFKPKSVKPERLEAGIIEMAECASLTLESDILAIQWSKVNQIFAFTASTLELYDVRELKLIERVPFSTLSLVSPSIHISDNEANVNDNLLGDIAQRIGVYGGKIFTLGYKELRIGTLLTWADRIHLYVQKGDFPSAIDLAHAYYIGEAEAGTDNLPQDAFSMRTVVGNKLTDLLEVSVQYAFAEGTLTGGGYSTPGKRSVNQTSLLQDLVGSVTRACITLNRLGFLFDEVFPRYDVAGLSNMFLERLEPFILDGLIHTIPVQISKRIIAKHRKDGQFEELERFVLHVPPVSLESAPTIAICQEFNLYDGLIYLYTAESHNYISPFVELLKLVKTVLHKRETSRSFDFSMSNSMVFNAYKIFSYMEAILCGLAYPSLKPLPEDGDQAQTAVYTFLFKNQSGAFAADDDGTTGTHPNVTLLLQFDAEVFLHTMDVAFEQGYLNNDTFEVTRQTICDSMVDILDTPDSRLSQPAMTFINIFLARNVPKYPQFIQLKPASLSQILHALLNDPEEDTLEDRQLAAEFLLSVHKVPQDDEEMTAAFEKAGFTRLADSRRNQQHL